MWPQSEERLFERFQKRRDGASLAQVFDRMAPALLRVAMHLCRDRHAAEDLVQQTFVVAIEKAKTFDRERGLFPWLVGILTNRSRLLRRAQQRRISADDVAARAAEQPDDAAERRELEQKVEDAITELGDTYRPVLHLHLFHGLNAKEIAAAIGRPAGSVRTQLVRGLKRLRLALPVGLGVALVSGGTLAAMRQRLLDTLPTSAATSGLAGATLLGGLMTKKLLLVVPLLLLTAFASWQVLVSPTQALPEQDHAVVDPASADLPTDAEADASMTSASPGNERAAVASSSSPDEASGSVVVAVRFGESEASAMGTWIRMRPEPWAYGGKRFGIRADANGQARFDEVPPGKWRVLAETGWVEDGATLDVEGGGEHRVALQLERAAEVRVRVVDEAQRPVAGAEIWVAMAYLGRVWPMAVTTRLAGQTDEYGRATVAGGQQTRVGARKAGYAASLSTTIGAAKGEEVLLQLSSDQGSLAGAVMDETGAPIENAEIYLCAGKFDARSSRRAADGREDAAPASVHTCPSSDGAYAVPDLRPGTYHVIAIAPNHLDAELDVEIRPFEQTPLRIVMRRSQRVNVRTTRPDGSPIAGLMVYGRDPQGKICGGGSITDRNGRFGFWAPLAGYKVEVKRGQKLIAERRSEAPLTSPVDVDIVVDEHLLVRGRVLDEQQQPLVGWRVVAIDDLEPEGSVTRAFAFAQSVRTDADGTFELWGDLDRPLQLVARGPNSYSDRDKICKRAVPVGTDGLDIVVPTGNLPRSVVTGRVVDDTGRLLADAIVKQLLVGDDANQCTDGTFRIEGLRHGKLQLHVVAAGFGGRRLEFDVQDTLTDVGDIALQPAVELRVRPVFPAGTEWLGPLPRATIRSETGAWMGAMSHNTVVDGVLVFSQLPPGKYQLHPHYEEEIAAAPVPFELLAGVPLQVDWPVRVGRKRHVVFLAPPEQPAVKGTMLKVVIKDHDGNVVHEEDRKVSQDAWAVWNTFVPGTYHATASSTAGHRFDGTFEVKLDDSEKRVDIPAKR